MFLNVIWCSLPALLQGVMRPAELLWDTASLYPIYSHMICNISGFISLINDDILSFRWGRLSVTLVFLSASFTYIHNSDRVRQVTLVTLWVFLPRLLYLGSHLDNREATCSPLWIEEVSDQFFHTLLMMHYAMCINRSNSLTLLCDALSKWSKHVKENIEKKTSKNSWKQQTDFCYC